jgi:hypothetical protein
MTNKLATTAALALIAFAGLGIDNAHATPGWTHGTPQGAFSPCGTSTIVQVGYWNDPGQFPKTGDTSYIRAVAQLECAVSDHPNFSFFLPPGVELAITPQTPVICTRGIGSGTGSPVTSDGHCLQAPVAVTRPDPRPHRRNGFLFGAGRIDTQGEWVEIRVPVTYQKRAPESLDAVINTQAGLVTATVNLDVGYRAELKNMAGLGRFGALHVSFELRNYYEAGTLFIDYGTTQSFGSTIGMTAVPTGYVNYPNVTGSVGGLQEGVTYYWRPRFVTSFGTFTGATQSATVTSTPIGCAVRGRC